MNISHFPGVVIALEKMGILEKLLDCVYLHKEARDVVESTALLMRGTYVLMGWGGVGCVVVGWGRVCCGWVG